MFDFFFKNKKTKWELGPLKNLDDITLHDMKSNPIWINDLSGESLDDFDETSERPMLNEVNISESMITEFTSIAMLVEFPDDNLYGSANLEENGKISSVAVWEQNNWIVGRKFFDSKEVVIVKGIPRINEEEALFLYDSKSDTGKRK